MRTCCLLLAALAVAGALRATDAPQEEFTLLALDKQPKETLAFFVHHAPQESVTDPAEAAKFGPLPEGVTAHLTGLGYLAGRELFAVRYLDDARLTDGSDGAVGLVLLCGSQSDPPRFAPLVVAWNEEPVSDYSVSPVRRFGDFSFFWLRREYSGNGHFVGRTAISAPDAATPLRAYSLFAAADPLADLTRRGWEPWHRGNYFDEETLTWHYHLYRDPAKAAGKDAGLHRRVRVRYQFRDGKLRPGKPQEENDD